MQGCTRCIQFERRRLAIRRRNGDDDDVSDQNGVEPLRHRLLLASYDRLLSRADDRLRNTNVARRVLRALRRAHELESVAGGGHTFGGLRRQLPDGAHCQRHVLFYR